MKTLEQARSCSWLWPGLVRKFPELRYGPAPTIDAIVVEFLRQHDVFVKPTGSNLNASGGSTMLMAAAGGPIAVAANQGITAQKKAAALQEWTSWKQWTLSHADWPEFKKKYEQEYSDFISKANARFEDEEVQDFIKLEEKKYIRTNRIFGYSILGLLGFAVLLIVVSNLAQVFSQKSKERSTLPANSLSELQRQELCKAVISMTMGQSTTIMKSNTTEADLERVEYDRPSDGKRWKYECMFAEDSKNIVWRGVDVISEGEGPGRWRNSELDDKFTYSVTGNDSFTIKRIYADGNTEVKAFSLKKGV